MTDTAVEPLAEVVERDDDEPEQVPEPPADPEPDEDETPQPEAPEARESQALMEEIGKKLDGLQKHVAKRLGEILGEDATLFEECEVCSFTNTPGWRMKGEYPAPVAEAVRAILGQRAAADYVADTHSQVCTECNGNGQVASGSNVQGQELLPCVNCRSRGWTPTDEKRQTPGEYRATAANGDTPQPDAPVPVAVQEDTPEIAALKAQGYIIVAPPR